MAPATIVYAGDEVAAATTALEPFLSLAFPEPTLHRLREIKQRVDPGDVFHQNFPLGV